MDTTDAILISLLETMNVFTPCLHLVIFEQVILRWDKTLILEGATEQFFMWISLFPVKSCALSKLFFKGFTYVSGIAIQ